MVLKASYAYAKAILTESKHGYGLLFLGLDAESMAATHNFPPTRRKTSFLRRPEPSSHRSEAKCWPTVLLAAKIPGTILP